ncbi:MAG: MBOAT family protein [Lachnospiraceae bacterium]|nr:MBOAT family protein [Lachnospiraceae bacterium]
MVFSSILFLCIFLPITIVLYYTLPKQCKNAVLLFSSLIFYAWGEPKYVLLMILSISANYLFGILMEKGRRKAVLVTAVVFNLGLLAFFKYTDFFIININNLTGADILLLKLALPIGISFYTFQTLSYVIDVYKGKVSPQRNIAAFGMYISFFPQLIAGPIVRYSDIEGSLKSRNESAENFFNGMMRFSCGLAKKVLLANSIGLLFDEIYSGGRADALTSFIGALAFTFQIYYDFSGYSDMAIGLGKMFSFTFPENFNHPYEAESITEFWRRWHISLGSWFREYVYIPLGGNRLGKGRQILNLLIVWALTGFWHGANWNFLIWGLFYFVLLLAEKLFLLKAMKKCPKVLKHAYTLFFVLLGWVIFACDKESFPFTEYIKCLFGANGFISEDSLYYLNNYLPLFVILTIGATSLPAKIGKKIKGLLEKEDCNCGINGRSMAALTGNFKNKKNSTTTTLTRKRSFLLALCIIYTCTMIGFSIVFLLGDTYNPFLYFRF